MRVYSFVQAFVLATTILAVAAAAPPSPAASTASPPPAASSPPLPWKNGPTQVNLGHDLTLALSDEHRFLDAAPAAKALESMGSFHNDNLLGVVTKAGEDWFVTISYWDDGYIKDDEAVDADELLSTIREGTEESNKERVEKGFKALRIDGWSDPPRYEKSVHHLVWALIVSDDDGKSVNYNTRILGRRGYVSINLVTEPESLAIYKPHAAALLKATSFGSGARYEDFDKKTDKVAEFGLAGLVLGGAGLAAAKLVKVGLLAKFSKVIIGLLIAGKKAIIALLIGAGALAKKFFSGRKKNEMA